MIAGVDINEVDRIFTNQEQVNRLNSINQDLLRLLIDYKILIDENTMIGGSSVLSYKFLPTKKLKQNNTIYFDLFDTQEKIHLFNSINLTLLEFLLDRSIISNHNEFKSFFSDEEIIANLNSMDFHLLSILIDGIINNNHLKELKKLKGNNHDILVAFKNKYAPCTSHFSFY